MVDAQGQSYKHFKVGKELNCSKGQCMFYVGYRFVYLYIGRFLPSEI